MKKSDKVQMPKGEQEALAKTDAAARKAAALAPINAPRTVAASDPTVFTPNQEALFKLAEQCVQAGKVFAEKFRSVVAFVHANEMLPNEVNPVLLAAGLNPQRVSEVKRIAYGPEWEAFRDGKLGFKAALEKARETGPASSPKGRKKTKKNKKFDELCKHHSKAALGFADLHGVHFYGDNAMLVFQVRPGEHKFNTATCDISLLITMKQAADGGAIDHKIQTV